MYTIEKIVNIITNTGVIADITTFNPKLDFKENGVDSLDVFTIFLAVEEGLNVKFSEEESGSIKSAWEMMQVLNSKT